MGGRQNILLRRHPFFLYKKENTPSSLLFEKKFGGRGASSNTKRVVFSPPTSFPNFAGPFTQNTPPSWGNLYAGLCDTRVSPEYRAPFRRSLGAPGKIRNPQKIPPRVRGTSNLPIGGKNLGLFFTAPDQGSQKPLRFGEGLFGLFRLRGGSRVWI